MINRLANQLKNLAENNDAVFREAIKKRLNGITTDEQIGAVKEFIFLLPPTLKVLTGYWSDKATPHEIKNLSGLIIDYILQPNDFISEDGNGLFGYMDDAYLVVSAFIRIQDLYLRDWQNKSPEEIDLTQRARRLMATPKIIIPDESSRIDEIIDMCINGKIESLEEYISARR